MKIKKILTFVFAAALMTSCGNEDGPGETAVMVVEPNIPNTSV